MLDTAFAAARAAGRIIEQNYYRTIEVHSKGLRDLVTEVDLAAQEVIVDTITARFPQHAILAEEGLGSLDELGEYTWIVDPLDGTTNYAFRLPIFAVSIGLAYRGESVLGVVYDPMRDQMFHAQVGQGAFLNGAPLHVAQRKDPIGTLVAFDSPRESDLRQQLVRILNHIAPQIGTLRALGSAALGPCYVAAGWLDAYLHLRLAPWDTAAAAVIVREAGGRATDLAGQPWTLATERFLAASDALHPLLVALIGDALA
ncbi:MAG: inositol monophosphatase family protein [Chloroflexota bacterium]